MAHSLTAIPHCSLLRWNFLEYFSDLLLSNHLQIPEMLFSCSCFPPVYKEAVLHNQILGFTLSSAFFSKVLSSTVLTTASGFVITSHQGLNHFDYVIGVCPYHISCITSV